jgi:hypothetical protein
MTTVLSGSTTRTINEFSLCIFYLLNYEQAYECVFNEDSIFRWSDRHTVSPMVVVLREVVTYRRHHPGH